MVLTALPASLGYAALIGAEVALMLTFFGIKVGMARKKFNVPLPNLYAYPGLGIKEEDAKKFNCIQRGHQNTLEAIPVFVGLYFAPAIAYPLFAFACAQLYVIGRVLYFQGYCTGNPSSRSRGSVGYIGLISLLVTTFYIGGSVVARELGL